MKTFLTISLLGLASQVAVADQELDRIKGSFDAAVDRAVAPLRVTYEKELRKLMDRHTKAGNLTAAVEVKAEIERLTGKPVVDPSTKGTATATSKPPTIEDYFVGKTWRTPTGTNFCFEKDGKGTRNFGSDETVFRWKKRSKDLVEAVGPANQGGSDRTWFFRFVSRDEAYYGDSEKTATAELQSRP